MNTEHEPLTHDSFGNCPICEEKFEQMVDLRETRSVEWHFMYMTDKVCLDRRENEDVAYVHGEPI